MIMHAVFLSENPSLNEKPILVKNSLAFCQILDGQVDEESHRHRGLLSSGRAICNKITTCPRLTQLVEVAPTCLPSQSVRSEHISKVSTTKVRSRGPFCSSDPDRMRVAMSPF